MTKLQSLIKNLKKANQKLKEAVSLEPTRIHKDAVLQRFEFTFDLAWKTIFLTQIFFEKIDILV